MSNKNERIKDEHDTDKDELMRMVREAFRDDASEELGQQLRKSLHGFRDDLTEHPYVRKQEKRQEKLANGARHAPIFAGFRLALITGCSGLVVLIALLVHVFNAPASWATVSETFKSVPFLSAVIYMKNDALDDPMQYEIWSGREGQVRIRYGSQVIFGKNGKVTKAFDIKERKQATPDNDAVNMIDAFFKGGGFSLETVLSTFQNAEMIDATPEVNADVEISEDLVVFDVQSKRSNQWLRIWALRESKLPVRVRMWDARDGESVDCFFTYSKEQPKKFFDPMAFEKELADRGTTTTNVAYALLKDPGGRAITTQDIKEPEDLSSEIMEDTSQYHMPKVMDVGAMKDGAIWVVASKAKNRMPDGDSFNGFSDMTDNLGREYYRAYSSWRSSDNKSTQVFLPEDYPFDERRAESLTVTCKGSYLVIKPGEHAIKKEIIVGSVEVDEIEAASSYPDRMDDFLPRIRMADEHLRNSQALRKGERILKSITGDPDKSDEALQRDKLFVELLVKQKRFEHAVEIAKRIEAPLLKKYGMWNKRFRRRDGNWNNFSYLLSALAGSGRIDEARELFRKIDNSPVPEPPRELGKPLQKKYSKDMEEGAQKYIDSVAYDILGRAEITIKQLSQIFGTDVMTDSRFKTYHGNFRQLAREEEQKMPWREHQRKVADHYLNNPLPETVEFLPTDAKKGQFRYFDSVIPGIASHSSRLLLNDLNWFFGGGGGFGSGFVRMTERTGKRNLTFDMVYNKETSSIQRSKALLEHLGLEIIEQTESRPVLIARHDGRELKPYREVKAPLPSDQHAKDQIGRMKMAGGLNLDLVFNELVKDQNADQQARGILIDDQTGLTIKPKEGETPTYVPIAYECPDFKTAEGLEMAKKWYKEQFGITFTEETRPSTVYLIREKKRTIQVIQ